MGSRAPPCPHTCWSVNRCGDEVAVGRGHVGCGLTAAVVECRRAGRKRGAEASAAWQRQVPAASRPTCTSPSAHLASAHPPLLPYPQAGGARQGAEQHHQAEAEGEGGQVGGAAAKGERPPACLGGCRGGGGSVCHAAAAAILVLPPSCRLLHSCCRAAAVAFDVCIALPLSAGASCGRG